MELFSTPERSLGVAVAALLVVLGFRFARPRSPAGWVAFVAYAGALAVTLLAERRMLAGPAREPSPLLRVGGAAVMLAGLVVAGAPLRRRASPEALADPAARAGITRPAALGLGLVLVGALARAPSLAGALAVATAVVALAVWAARGAPDLPRRA